MFDTLVFSGGGPASIAMVGCVRFLEHVGLLHQVNTLVGTSAGAIMAFLIALGMSSYEIESWIVEHASTGMLNALDIERILEFPSRFGIDDGSGVVECIRTACAMKLGAQDVTFSELAKRTGKRVVVCVANLTNSQHEFLSIDKHPDLSVIDALRMSFGIPLFFTPVVYDGCVYVDGGLFNNLPTDYVFLDSAAGCRNALALSVDFDDGPSEEQEQDQEQDQEERLPRRPRGPRGPPVHSVWSYMMLLLRAVVKRAQPPHRPPGLSDGGPSVRLVWLRVLDILSCNKNNNMSADDAGSSNHDESGTSGGGKSCLNFSLESMTFELEPSLVSALIQSGYDTLQADLDDDVCRIMLSCDSKDESVAAVRTNQDEETKSHATLPQKDDETTDETTVKRL